MCVWLCIIHMHRCAAQDEMGSCRRTHRLLQHAAAEPLGKISDTVTRSEGNVTSRGKHAQGTCCYYYSLYSLCGNFGGLSFTSVRVILTSVVPDSPPMWPPMSLAWMTTSYSCRASRSMFGKAVRMIPEQTDFNVRLKHSRGLGVSTPKLSQWKVIKRIL